MAEWNAPSMLANFASVMNERAPHIDRTGTILYFVRAAAPATADLFWARREPGALAWEPAQPVAGVNSGLEEDDPWVSVDQRTIYFARRTDDRSETDLYMATR